MSLIVDRFGNPYPSSTESTSTANVSDVTETTPLRSSDLDSRDQFEIADNSLSSPPNNPPQEKPPGRFRRFLGKSIKVAGTAAGVLGILGGAGIAVSGALSIGASMALVPVFVGGVAVAIGSAVVGKLMSYVGSKIEGAKESSEE